jgi:DUF4097 and DUF4098 domain-containing protein YvlB
MVIILSQLSVFIEIKKLRKTLMKNSRLILTVLSFFLLVSFSALAQEEVNKSFDAKSMLKVVSVSGDCTIEKSTNNKIEVHLTYTFSDDCFEYIINETADRLEIREKFNNHGSCSGMSKWTIRVPENIEVRFSSASGDFYMNGIHNGVKASTASGDLTVKNTVGNVDLNTASGDIEVEFTKGSFDLSSASGDVDAVSVEITDESYFSSASGDVGVVLLKSSDYDLKLSSASGNSVLDYNGNEIKGFFEFTARVDKGDIISPIAFDKEEVIEKYDHEYDVKSFTKGNSSPKITLKTASGKAKLIK